MNPQKVFVQLTKVGQGTLVLEGTLLQKEIMGKIVNLLDFTTNPQFLASQCDQILEDGAIIAIPDTNGGTKNFISIGEICLNVYVIADTQNKD